MSRDQELTALTERVSALLTKLSSGVPTAEQFKQAEDTIADLREELQALHHMLTEEQPGQESLLTRIKGLERRLGDLEIVCRKCSIAMVAERVTALEPRIAAMEAIHGQCEARLGWKTVADHIAAVATRRARWMRWFDRVMVAVLIMAACTFAAIIGKVAWDAFKDAVHADKTETAG